MTAQEFKTASEFQRLTGLTPQRLSQLVARGIVPKGARGRYPWPQANLDYIDHLERVAAGRGGADSDVDLSKERALLAREQRKAQEIKNASLSGDLVEKAAVDRAWGGFFSVIRARMLAVPSNLTQILSHLTRHDVDAIDREIRDALNEAADEIGADN